MNKRISCFLPCRKGSERVLNKNTRKFAGYEFGLTEIKLNQLLKTQLIDEIVLSTNDESIIEYARKMNDKRIRLHIRDASLAQGTTSTDQLVSHAIDLIPNGHILWTHVTSPFISNNIYDKIISDYFKKLKEGYDSLMTVTEIQSFLWKNNTPLNYNRKLEKWPRTQTLDTIQHINSGAFIASTKIYDDYEDRIGLNPFLYSLNKNISHDIDWMDDFILAECMLEKGIVKI